MPAIASTGYAVLIRAASVVAVAGALAASASGQSPASCPIKPGALSGPGTITGTVTDTGHVSVDGVEVFIASPRRQTVSANGAFRLDQLEQDRYEVTARRIGYEAQTRTVTVGDSGGVTAFCLVPAPPILETIVSSATRSGLTGVVADSAHRVIPGAQISVLGGFGERGASDSAGSFYIPLRPGRYMVRVRHSGFATKMVSISIPRDSGRKMLIWLESARRGASPRDEWAARELAFRLDTATGAWSKVFTREDIANFPSKELTQLARAGAVSNVDDECQAIIDGGPYTMPLWSLTADDLEMVEVYTDKPPRAGATSILVPRRRAPAKSGVGGCPHVFAWLRK